MTAPRTAAGRALGDYLRGSFVYEADDTERIDVTDRILAIEAEAGAEPLALLRALVTMLDDDAEHAVEEMRELDIAYENHLSVCRRYLDRT